MSDSYVCSGAMMRCTMGTSTANLTVLPIRTVFLTGQPMANISDHKSMVNLAPFGLCRSLGFPATASATAAAMGTLTPMPCMHNTPMPWMGGKMDYLVKGQPALLKSCKCQCMWGGTISLVTDGQVGEGVQYVQKKPKEMIFNIVELSNQYVNKPIPKEFDDLSESDFGEHEKETLLSLGRDKYCKLFSEIKQKRSKIAYDFYRSTGMDDDYDIKSEMNGIDFDYPVEIVELPPPDELYQYVRVNGTSGSYCIIPPIHEPECYGIWGEGRGLQKFTFNNLSEKSRFLRSTASAILAPLDNDWSNQDSTNWAMTKGGGIQYVNKDCNKILMRIEY